MKPKASDTTEEKQGKHLFKSGDEWTGNRAGRPKGSKNKLSEDFISALCRDFEENGEAVIQTVRSEKPADYLKIIASIVPKELTINRNSIEDMSDEELLDNLEQVRSLAAALVGSNGSKASSGSGASRRDRASRGKPN